MTSFNCFFCPTGSPKPPKLFYLTSKMSKKSKWLSIRHTPRCQQFVIGTTLTEEIVLIKIIDGLFRDIVYADSPKCLFSALWTTQTSFRRQISPNCGTSNYVHDTTPLDLSETIIYQFLWFLWTKHQFLTHLLRFICTSSSVKGTD